MYDAEILVRYFKFKIKYFLYDHRMVTWDYQSFIVTSSDDEELDRQRAFTRAEIWATEQLDNQGADYYKLEVCQQ